MKTLLTTTTLALLLSATALHAQETEKHGTRLGIGIEGLSGDNKRGLGYSLQIQSPIAENINWTITLGKADLKSTHKVFPVPKYKYLLLKGGARYFAGRHFYLAGDIGAAFDQVRHNRTYFAWSPGLGAEVSAFGSNRFDIGLRYEGYTTDNNINFLALRFALNFGY